MGLFDRRSFLRATGASGIAALAGCSSLSGGGSGNNELNKLGFTSYVRGGSWITAYVEAAKFYSKDQDIEIDVRPNQQSASKQVQDIRDFVNKGYDAILVGVWQTGAAKDAIQYALDKDVPVIATNADTANENIPMYVGFSNYEGGEKSGEQMVKYLKEQNSGGKPWQVLNIRGPQGNQSANQRSQGFLDVIEQASGVEVADTINGEFAQDTAQNKVQQWVNNNGTPDGIYSGNLSMGLGVYKALKNLDILYKADNENHVTLTQMDGSPQVNPLVKQGYIDAAVDQPNYFYNPLAIHYLQKVVKNGDSAVPDVGTQIAKADLDIPSSKHKGVDLWSKSIWAPAEVKKQNGHPWFKTNSIVITNENADKPFLWGNVWG